ncbi:MAG: prepilin-type N-terminal cleavage/methylation domain-containing protein [Candidatus Omnitrophica bacterium]|nr:prepilin-type N-terminal cleavage/methylation domain-containing protein [Candidatus Omnitrophota bacterium]
MICFLKKQSGFSLVELMVVCVLISVLLGIAIPAYLNVRNNADKQKGIFNLYAINKAQKQFYFDQEPQTYTALLTDLSPAYGTISIDDGTWTYSLVATGPTYTATAAHMLPDGTPDGNSISIDQDGSIDETNW